MVSFPPKDTEQPLPSSPLLLGHPAVDGDSREVLLHQELRQGDAALHGLHKDHHLCVGVCVHVTACMCKGACAHVWCVGGCPCR